MFICAVPLLLPLNSALPFREKESWFAEPSLQSRGCLCLVLRWFTGGLSQDIPQGWRQGRASQLSDPELGNQALNSVSPDAKRRDDGGTMAAGNVVGGPLECQVPGSRVCRDYFI